MGKASIISKIFYLMLVLVVCACSHAPSSQKTTNETNILANDLAMTIHSLSKAVSVSDADQTSRKLINITSALAEHYKINHSPLFHNVLVNTGVKKRGLCCHWAEDLHQELRRLKISSLKFDWLVSRLGSKLREHNTIVIYAADSSWSEGIVYDPWREAGKPYWIKVADDKYPWVRHPLSGQWNLLRCK
jgi:hypothetical protein